MTFLFWVNVHADERLNVLMSFLLDLVSLCPPVGLYLRLCGVFAVCVHL